MAKFSSGGVVNEPTNYDIYIQLSPGSFHWRCPKCQELIFLGETPTSMLLLEEAKKQHKCFGS